MQISRIRLSDKTSRLRPRHVVPKPGEADETEVDGVKQHDRSNDNHPVRLDGG